MRSEREKMNELDQDLVDKKRVESSVKALLELIKTAKSSVSLIATARRIDLQFSLSNVSMKRHIFTLNLPHSIDEDEREACIFVKDLDLKDREYEKTVLRFQSMFTEKGITRISKIVPIKALRTDYSQPQDKRTLAKAYDLFLCDKRVISLLPGLLGKSFYSRKKTIPRGVDFMSSDLKEEIDRAIDDSMCNISGKGDSSSVQVGHNKMTTDELVDNITEAIRSLAEKVPGGRNNIKNIYIRTPEMTAIPMYCNFVNPVDIELPDAKPKKLASYVDDVTTVEGGSVYVRADGFVKVINNKRKLSEETTDEIDEKKPKRENEEKLDEDESGKMRQAKGKQKQKKNKNFEKSKSGKKNESKNFGKGERLKDLGSDAEIEKEDVCEIVELQEEKDDSESKESVQKKRKIKKREDELDVTGNSKQTQKSLSKKHGSKNMGKGKRQRDQGQDEDMRKEDVCEIVEIQEEKDNSESKENVQKKKKIKKGENDSNASENSKQPQKTLSKKKNESKNLGKGKRQRDQSQDDDIKKEDVCEIVEIHAEKEDDESKENVQRKKKMKKRENELDTTGNGKQTQKSLSKKKNESKNSGEDKRQKDQDLDDDIKKEDVTEIVEIKEEEEEDNESKESRKRKKKIKKGKQLQATKVEKVDIPNPIVGKKQLKKGINKRQSAKQNVLK